MDLRRAEEFFEHLSNIVDHPLYDDSVRVNLSATLAVSSMQFAAAVRVLCAEGLMLGASTTLRSQFEALVRCVWVLHRATDQQVEKLSADLNHETQQASKNIPQVNEMLAELKKIPQLTNLLVSLNEFKESSWLPLNSFVHSGIHAIHWTKNEAPPQLIDQIFRISNGLSLLAFQSIGILTGRQGIQSEIISVIARYSSCLPKYRENI
ncbi:hypothetical protein SAMN05216603_1031 [Pseudomonas benzenivorans]|nr:DUF5677 domain-containing protein [Pseudomonas benzenivorans]SDG67641.1 hypothetical protein SAMN05216603_1031 [Pseudomonas benzenivorans]